MRWRESEGCFECPKFHECPLEYKPIEVPLDTQGTFFCWDLLDLREALLEIYKREERIKIKKEFK